MLRPCNFKGEVFSKLQGFPTGMKAVTTWVSQDEAWTDVANGLEIAFEKFGKEPGAPAPPGSEKAVELAPTVSTAPLNKPPLQPLEDLSAAQEENRALAEISTQGFRGLRALMADPRIKEFVAEQREPLESADDALQKLVNYKDVHDRLHDLQFKCYNYIFQEARKAEDEVDWNLLVQPRKDLKSLKERLVEAEALMIDEDFDWLEQLRSAETQLLKAAEELSLPPLQESGRSIKGILEIRPTIFDTKLCTAAKLLPLDSLRQALGVVRGKIRPDSLKGNQGVKFSVGVDALPELSQKLTLLTGEHERWQRIATMLWQIDALISEDLTGLRKNWPKLFQRIKEICEKNPAIWASSILAEANNLDRLLAEATPGNAKDFIKWQKKIGQSYTSLSTECGTRFYQVDLSLKRLCDELREVQAALGSILQELLCLK
jgi:hypothetical protein